VRRSTLAGALGLARAVALVALVALAAGCGEPRKPAGGGGGALSCACLEAAAPADVGGHCAAPPDCAEDEAGNFTLQCMGKSLGG
jgi:hypothetical protein